MPVIRFKAPTPDELRMALEYEPSNKWQPLVGKTDFYHHKAGTRIGTEHSGMWFMRLTSGSGKRAVSELVFLRHLVWLVVQGKVAPGYKVELVKPSGGNRIGNLKLVNKRGEVLLPQTVLRKAPKAVQPAPPTVPHGTSPTGGE